MVISYWKEQNFHVSFVSNVWKFFKSSETTRSLRMEIVSKFLKQPSSTFFGNLWELSEVFRSLLKKSENVGKLSK